MVNCLRPISFPVWKRIIQVEPSLRGMPTDPIERGHQLVLSKEARKDCFKGPDRRKNVHHHEKKKMVNNLITDLLEPNAAKSMSIVECQVMKLGIPARLPPANGLTLSAEDEVLFRYFCIDKPAVWISTKQFNRDVPWCLVSSLDCIF